MFFLFLYIKLENWVHERLIEIKKEMVLPMKMRIRNCPYSTSHYGEYIKIFDIEVDYVVLRLVSSSNSLVSLDTLCTAE